MSVRVSGGKVESAPGGGTDGGGEGAGEQGGEGGTGGTIKGGKEQGGVGLCKFKMVKVEPASFRPPYGWIPQTVMSHKTERRKRRRSQSTPVHSSPLQSSEACITFGASTAGITTDCRNVMVEHLQRKANTTQNHILHIYTYQPDAKGLCRLTIRQYLNLGDWMTTTTCRPRSAVLSAVSEHRQNTP